ncbi:hypothetical protein [Kitasatospora sp. NPDC015120]|uniref:hypothetical protein n=1 Tax=Kitasatospora sp. NPDC015120 TaxID=3364023 RepID=UPI0036F472B0
MDDEESLRRFGPHPAGAHLDEIRRLPVGHTERERHARGDGDTELMKLCCVRLFRSGDLDDALLVRNAKQAGFDAACSIETGLLLGRGLGPATAHLAAHPSPSAPAAPERLRALASQGAFEGFPVEKLSAGDDRYDEEDRPL